MNRIRPHASEFLSPFKQVWIVGFLVTSIFSKLIVLTFLIVSSPMTYYLTMRMPAYVPSGRPNYAASSAFGSDGRNATSVNNSLTSFPVTSVFGRGLKFRF